MNTEKKILSHLPHKKLSSKFWKEKRMIPEFRESLLNIADSFIEYLGIPIDVLDITMTGSYANYNYTVFSDIDLHILIDMSLVNEDTDLVEEFFKAKRKFWNDRHDIELKGVEVELYPQDTKEDAVSSGVYSILKDEWLIKPKKFRSTFDIDSVKKNADKLTKEIKIAIKNSIKNSSTEDIDSIT